MDAVGANDRSWLDDTGFMRFAWVCSVRDNYEHYQKVGAPGNPGMTTFK